MKKYQKLRESLASEKERFFKKMNINKFQYNTKKGSLFGLMSLMQGLSEMGVNLRESNLWDSLDLAFQNKLNYLESRGKDVSHYRDFYDSIVESLDKNPQFSELMPSASLKQFPFRVPHKCYASEEE
jgi:hypothetical protein